MWRTLFRLGLVMLCVAALSFVAAPWFAFRALKSYARDGDVQGLAELVDYKSVRASLRSQRACRLFRDLRCGADARGPRKPERHLPALHAAADRARRGPDGRHAAPECVGHDGDGQASTRIALRARPPDHPPTANP